MESHHATILSMLPPWIGILVGHVADDMTVSNIASVASIAYCVIGCYVMLRKRK